MTQSCWLDRRFHWCAAGLLLAMAVAQFVPAVLDSQIVDEGIHVTAGYAFLRSRAINVGEHPPLGQAASALPLLALDLRPPGPPDRKREPYREQDFLYRNRYPADTILLIARSAHLLITLFLGGLIAWWMRRHFGAPAALAALAMFAFDPNLIAHGHYATTDVPAALGFLAACLSWNAFLKNGSARSAALCGVCAGLAMSIKYSALLLFPIFLYLYGIRAWQQDQDATPPPYRCSFLHLARSLTVVVGVMLAVIFVMFGFETGPLIIPGQPILDGPPLFSASPAIESFAARASFPMPSFFRGVYVLIWHNVSGHRAYLLGQRSIEGWWYYFPVIVLIKTLTGVLLLLLLANLTACRAILRGGAEAAITKLRGIRPEWFVITLPPLFYFGIAVRSHIDIGIRHVLPVYPFLFLWIGAVLFGTGWARSSRFVSRAAVLCLVLAAMESAAAFPRYLAFFNAPSGGRTQGWKYVVDSNLDWGQDIKRLRDYVAKNKVPRVCIGAFGITPVEYYGFAVQQIPDSRAEAEVSGCLVAASITLVSEWEDFDKSMGWVARLRPTDTVGDSLWIYDLKRHPGAGQVSQVQDAKPR
jgi:hypothetical protein